MALMKKMAAVAVTGSLLFGLVGTAFAADATQIGTAANRLQTLGIVNGMTPTGDLQLDQTLTRAQLMKIMVWAYGQKDNAAILKGAVAFPDTSTHWASGEIAIAKNIIVEKNGFTMGMPDGNFAPEAKLTAAQAVAFMVKFLGIAPTNDAWPANYINAAVNAGLITTADAATIKDVETTRGFAFFLADQAFAAKGANGKSVYTTYVKPTAPVITAEAAEVATTATKVTVTGTVSKDATTVFVGTPAKTISVVDGKFSFEADLAVGANNIVIGATDIVGATTTKTVTVSRSVGDVATIEAPAAITVQAGGTADLAVTVKDANGAVIENATVAVSSDLGTFANGTFTAGTKTGTGVATVKLGGIETTVNVTVVAGDLAKITIEQGDVQLGIGEPVTFTVKGYDANNNEVAVTGASFKATGGIIDQEGNFAPTKAGNVTVTATVGGLTATSNVTVYGTAVGLRLNTPSDIVANGASKTTVTASVVDAAGNIVPNYTGKVNFIATDSNFSLSASSVDVVRGFASVEVTTGTTPSLSTLVQATSTGLSGANVAVKSVAQTLSRIDVAQDYSKIPADGTSYITLTLSAKDQDGIAMNAAQMPATLDIQLSSSSTGFAFNPADGIVHLGGTNTAEVLVISSSATPSSAVISGTVTTEGYTGVAVASSTVASALVGSPYKLAVTPVTGATANTTNATGTVQAVKVYVQDFNGNTVTNPNPSTVNITLTAEGPTGGTVEVSTDAGLTDATADTNTGAASNGAVTFYVTSTKAGTVSYNATAAWNNLTLANVGTSGTFVAGPAYQISLTATPTNIAGDAVLAADGTSSATITARISDSANNPVTTGSYEITFHKQGDNNATADFTDVVTASASGTATFTVTSATHGNTAPLVDTIRASATGLVYGEIAVKTAILGVPATFGDVTVNAGVAPTAGEAFSVVAEVRDANNNAIVSNNGQAAVLTVKDNNDRTVYTDRTTSVNGVVKFDNVKLTQVLGADYSFEISDPNGRLTAGDATGTDIVAAAPAKLTVATTFPTLRADANGTSVVTVSVADTYGNPAVLSATEDKTVTVRLSNPNIGALSAISGDAGFTAYNATTGAATLVAGESTGTLSFQASNVPGTGSITATYGTLTVGSADQSTAIIGNASKAVITSVTQNVAADNSTYATITIELRDANGNLDTSYNVASAGTMPVAVTSNGTSVTIEPVAQAGDAKVVQGKLTFQAKTSKAQTVTFTAAGVTGTGLASTTATATFVPGTASTVAATVTPFAIKGNGSAITAVTLKVTDNNGNLISTANGTMKVSVSDANFAFVQTAGADGVATINVVNGVATAVVQAKSTTSAAYVSLNVKYTMPGATTESSIDLTNVIGVGAGNDVAAPTVTAAYDAGTLTLTFSELMDKSSVTAANFTNRFALVETGDVFGTVTSATWNDAGNELTVVLDGATITGNLKAKTGVKDLAGNAASTTAVITNVITVAAI